VTQPIRPVDRRDPSVEGPDAVPGVPRVRLLSPAEREAARRRREELRKARATSAQVPRGAVDHRA
jgi:hypothetical protein